MALPATDTFTGTNGTALPTYSSNWAHNSPGAFAIHTNGVVPNSASNDGAARWTADSFNNNQYAQLQITDSGLTASFFIGPAVRISTSGANTFYGYYGIVVSANPSAQRYFFKYVAGVYTEIGSSTTAIPLNSILRIESNGTTITPILAGSTDTTVGGAITDSSIASGAAGICGWDATTTETRGDNWEGGNLGGAATTSQPFYRSPIRFMLVR